MSRYKYYITEQCNSVIKLELLCISALVGFLRKIVSLVLGHEQDKVLTLLYMQHQNKLCHIISRKTDFNFQLRYPFKTYRLLYAPSGLTFNKTGNERRCNVTLWRVRATIVTVGKQ